MNRSELIMEVAKHLSDNTGSGNYSLVESLLLKFPEFYYAGKGYKAISNRGLSDKEGIDREPFFIPSSWSLSEEGAKEYIANDYSEDEYYMVSSEIEGFNIYEFCLHVEIHFNNYGFESNPIRMDLLDEKEILINKNHGPNDILKINNSYGVFCFDNKYYSENGVDIKLWESIDDAYFFWKENYDFYKNKKLTIEEENFFEYFKRGEHVPVGVDFINEIKEKPRFTLTESQKRLLK